jgi:hypothetical protein
MTSGALEQPAVQAPAALRRSSIARANRAAALSPGRVPILGDKPARAKRQPGLAAGMNASSGTIGSSVACNGSRSGCRIPVYVSTRWSACASPRPLVAYQMDRRVLLQQWGARLRPRTARSPFAGSCRAGSRCRGRGYLARASQRRRWEMLLGALGSEGVAHKESPQAELSRVQRSCQG